jgi:hypothetical protein
MTKDKRLMTKKSFFQPLFTHSEQRDLANASGQPSALLDEEIDLVRVAIRRLFKISKDQAAQDPAEAVKTLAVLSAVSSRLASLIRTQQQLKTAAGATGDGELRIMLEKVLLEVQADWPQL